MMGNYMLKLNTRMISKYLEKKYASRTYWKKKYKNNIINYVKKEYRNDGSKDIIETREYIDGKLDGEHVRYHGDGLIRSTRLYVQGVLKEKNKYYR